MGVASVEGGPVPVQRRPHSCKNTQGTGDRPFFPLCSFSFRPPVFLFLSTAGRCGLGSPVSGLLHYQAFFFAGVACLGGGLCCPFSSSFLFLLFSLSLGCLSSVSPRPVLLGFCALSSGLVRARPGVKRGQTAKRSQRGRRLARGVVLA